MSRAAAQDGFFRGGNVDDLYLSPLTRGKLRVLEQRVFTAEDEEKILDGALYVYATTLEDIGGDDFWDAVDAFVADVPIATVLAFKAIFQADIAAISASMIEPIEAGKQSGEQSPTLKPLSTGQPAGQELAGRK